ncbi:MAG: hypothetical protein ACOCX4_07950 [Planctomycetota bacterium]
MTDWTPADTAALRDWSERRRRLHELVRLEDAGTTLIDLGAAARPDRTTPATRSPQWPARIRIP